MKRFEYKIEHFFLKETDSWLHSGSIERHFNYLGSKGWELIKVGDKVAFFKREIAGEELAKLEAEEKAKEAEYKAEEAERKAREAEENAKLAELEKANRYVESIPKSKRTSKHYAYIAELKKEEITFEEFKMKIDESIK